MRKYPHCGLIWGYKYRHATKGMSVFLGVHPHDGAALIMEEWDREDGDVGHLYLCEKSDLDLSSEQP